MGPAPCNKFLNKTSLSMGATPLGEFQFAGEASRSHRRTPTLWSPLWRRYSRPLGPVAWSKPSVWAANCCKTAHDSVWHSLQIQLFEHVCWREVNCNFNKCHKNHIKFHAPNIRELDLQTEFRPRLQCQEVSQWQGCCPASVYGILCETGEL